MIHPDYEQALERARARVRAHPQAFRTQTTYSMQWMATGEIDGRFELATASTQEGALQRVKEQMVRELALREPPSPDEPARLDEILATVRETNALVKQLLAAAKPQIGPWVMKSGDGSLRVRLRTDGRTAASVSYDASTSHPLKWSAHVPCKMRSFTNAEEAMEWCNEQLKGPP